MVKKRELASTDKLKVVDFFCGAGGMSCGMQAAGLEVLGGIDIDAECGRTYSANILGAKFLEADISTMQPSQLETLLPVKRHDPSLVLIGCSPCQFYSQICTDKTKSAKSAFLLQDFKRFVDYFMPGFVVVENVPRLKKVSVLEDFKADLLQMGYSISDGVLNASSFGVPQNRLRFVLIASRVGGEVSLPIPDTGPSPTVEEFIGPSNGFLPIPAGYRDTTPFQHSTAALTESNLLRIAMTPPNGGSRRAWAKHPHLQIGAYRERDDIFRDTYGRMSWGRPAPTITTKFLSLSNGRFGHPVEARAISVREGATLQTFPKTFHFLAPNLHGIAKQIGNAVPPALAHRIGLHLLQLTMQSDGVKSGYRGTVDGRVARAKATLEAVRSAYDALASSGRPATSTNILAITGGSKQSVLKHLKTIKLERKGPFGEEAPSINIEHLGMGVETLLQALAAKASDAAGAAPHFRLPLPPPHSILNEAIAAGYIGLFITPHGVDRLNLNLKQSQSEYSRWGRRRVAKAVWDQRSDIA